MLPGITEERSDADIMIMPVGASHHSGETSEITAAMATSHTSLPVIALRREVTGIPSETAHGSMRSVPTANESDAEARDRNPFGSYAMRAAMHAGDDASSCGNTANGLSGVLPDYIFGCGGFANVAGCDVLEDVIDELGRRHAETHRQLMKICSESAANDVAATLVERVSNAATAVEHPSFPDVASQQAVASDFAHSVVPRVASPPKPHSDRSASAAAAQLSPGEHTPNGALRSTPLGSGLIPQPPPTGSSSRYIAYRRASRGSAGTSPSSTPSLRASMAGPLANDSLYTEQSGMLTSGGRPDDRAISIVATLVEQLLASNVTMMRVTRALAVQVEEIKARAATKAAGIAEARDFRLGGGVQLSIPSGGAATAAVAGDVPFSRRRQSVGHAGLLTLLERIPSMVAGDGELSACAERRPLSINIAHPFDQALDEFPSFGSATELRPDGTIEFNRPDSVQSDVDMKDHKSTAVVNKDGDQSVCINQYMVVCEIGRGQQAPVIRAIDTDSNEDVAIKIIPRPRIRALANTSLQRNQLRQLKLMTQEIMAMKMCAHKNLVCLREVIDDPEAHSLFLVMEYVAGGVAARSKPDGSFDRRYTPKSVIRIARQLSAALQYLHQRGVFHRDVKPENILLRTNGEPCFCDFGVCDVLDHVGPLPTVARKSPQQRNNNQHGKGHRSDSRIRAAEASTESAAAATAAAAAATSTPKSGPTNAPSRENSSGGSSRPHSGTLPANGEQPMSFRGTVAFASPEALAHAVPGAVMHHSFSGAPSDNRFAADVYALGMSMYCLLYGMLPWTTHAPATFMQNVLDRPPPFPPVWVQRPPLASGEDEADDGEPPAALVEVLSRMLLRDPAARIDIEAARAILKALSPRFAHGASPADSAMPSFSGDGGKYF